MHNTQQNLAICPYKQLPTDLTLDIMGANALLILSWLNKNEKQKNGIQEGIGQFSGSWSLHISDIWMNIFQFSSCFSSWRIAQLIGQQQTEAGHTVRAPHETSNDIWTHTFHFNNLGRFFKARHLHNSCFSLPHHVLF